MSLRIFAGIFAFMPLFYTTIQNLTASFTLPSRGHGSSSISLSRNQTFSTPKHRPDVERLGYTYKIGEAD
jgi:hypothetical protein